MEWFSQWQQLKLQNIVELSLSSNSPKWLQNRDGQLIFLDLRLRGGWHTKNTCPIWLQILSYDFFNSMSDVHWILTLKKRSNVQFRNGVRSSRRQQQKQHSIMELSLSSNPLKTTTESSRLKTQRRTTDEGRILNLNADIVIHYIWHWISMLNPKYDHLPDRAGNVFFF